MRCLAYVLLMPIAMAVLLFLVFVAQFQLSAALPAYVSAVDQRSIVTCVFEITFALGFFLAMRFVDRHFRDASRHIDACVSQLDLPFFTSQEASSDAVGQSLLYIEGQIARYKRRHPVARATPSRQRRHRRIKPRTTRVAVTTTDGRSLIGNIKDVSLSGVAMSQLPRIKVGDLVRIGQRAATATRVWESGIAFAFSEELDPASFDEGIIL